MGKQGLGLNSPPEGPKRIHGTPHRQKILQARTGMLPRKRGGYESTPLSEKGEDPPWEERKREKRHQTAFKEAGGKMYSFFPEPISGVHKKKERRAPNIKKKKEKKKEPRENTLH